MEGGGGERRERETGSKDGVARLGRGERRERENKTRGSKDGVAVFVHLAITCYNTVLWLGKHMCTR